MNSHHRTNKAKQLSLQSHGHGGRREGAGRPKNRIPAISHDKRPVFQAQHPLHITVRLKAGAPNLRSKKAFSVFRKAVLKAQLLGLKVLEFAVLGNHFHALCEAESNAQLTRGMKSLNVCIARGLNCLPGNKRRKGQIVSHRFDAKCLQTPAQVRNVIAYIFANASKHFKRKQVFDWYCSFAVFADVEILKLIRKDLDWRRPTLEPKQVAFYQHFLSRPGSWLARTGWKRGLKAS